jgi:hypothetical protein
MLASGERIPAARVATAPNAWTTLREVAADGPVLLLFYLFDWSST